MGSPKTTVIFVRHAKSCYGEDDRIRPLSDEGLIDRQIVVETLKGRQIDCFYSSPYRRSIDTIQTAADHFGMPIHTDERFRERAAGSWDDTWLRKRWADFTCAEEGGECLQSVQKRNIEALEELLQVHEGKTIVIGTHGTALSTILNYFDDSFGLEDFLRIVSWMPYIVELTFEGKMLVSKTELAWVEKTISPR
jgi:2,3-bisphosphoglycerate-dependent phosphoglycerate mutase